MRQSMTIRLDPEVLAVAKQIAGTNNRTLTNYIETLIRKDIIANADPLCPIPSNHDVLFTAYSSVKITRRILEEKTGLWFGEILEELGKRGLHLPTVDSTAHFNDKQMTLYNTIFGAS